MPKYKKLTFDDLHFEPMLSTTKTLKASLRFSNGYGCNVYYRSAATNRELPYEFELTRNNLPTAHESISDGNIGYCSKDDISQLIHEAQKI